MSWFSEHDGFYGPDYLVEYEEILPKERTVAEINFVEKVLNLKPGSKILDVPCGYGRHLIELALRGYESTGAELNKFFLQRAKDEALTAGVDVALFQRDMRELDFVEEFDVAIDLFTSMGFFESDEEDSSFMAGVHKSLRSGGVFMVDFVNRSWLTKSMKQKEWRRLPNETILLIERKFDEVSGRKIEYRTKIQKGVIATTATISQRIYSTNELVSMGKKIGYTLQSAFGDFSGTELSSNSRRTILCFKKK